MRLINQSYEILGTPQSLEEAWSFVAKAARNCYQSEKVKRDETEEDFCRRVLLKGKDTTKMSYEEMEQFHLSPFEFGIVYLTDVPEAYRYKKNPYSRIIYYEDIDDLKGVTPHIYVTSNLRTILENHWEDDLKYAGPPTEHHVKACAFHLITNRAVMCELTRHEAALSFTCESTRYCNYSKGKFGSELTFIKPCWLALPLGQYKFDCVIQGPDKWDLLQEGESCEQWLFDDYAFYPVDNECLLLHSLEQIENTYIKLINGGWTPQQAATILPNALKVSIMMCGYEDNLQHVFNLRAEEVSGPVHPQMAEIMKPMYKEYIKYAAKKNI